MKSYIVDLKGMIKMLLNPEGLPGLDKAQHAEIALTSMDQYLETYARQTELNGYPMRFFAGKVAVTKDVNLNNTPVSPARSATNLNAQPKSPAALSQQNAALRQQQQTQQAKRM